MAELATQPNDARVTELLDAVVDEGKRLDCYAVLGLMKEATGAEPVMWGDSIVDFGCISSACRTSIPEHRES